MKATAIRGYVKDIVAIIDEKRHTIYEIEMALKTYRADKPTKKWEEGIEKDERKPVQILWAELQKERQALEELMNTRIVEEAIDVPTSRYDHLVIELYKIIKYQEEHRSSGDVIARDIKEAIARI